MGLIDRQQQLVEQLVGLALERRPEDREAFLEQACADTPEMRARIETLLSSNERAGSFLEKPLLSCGRSGLNFRIIEESDVTGPYTSDHVPLHNLAGNQPNLGPSPARFQPGQRIAGRFTIVRFIARGGMGEVYEVEDAFLQHVHIALKVIAPEIAADAGASHRFEQEVLLARKVTHPNLCPIYDISLCREPGPPFLFLTMKLLQGESLATRLRRPEPVPRAEAVSIFRQLVAGLAAIHAGGVIHRDIKPNNVMLEHAGSELCLSIMDFGLARLHASEVTVIAPGPVAGTPGYIAPELFLGHRPSQASDIYALGVLLHQVATGEFPTSKTDRLAVEPSPALVSADLPPALALAVREFLSEDPKRRCDVFQQLQANHSSLSVPDRVPVRSYPLLSRRRLVTGAALAACAAAVGVVENGEQIGYWLQPLPRKRFVALLDWPTPDARLKPMLLGVIDAIAGELARAEAFDHDLFVIAQRTTGDLTTPAQLNEARESLGANLVLAVYCVLRGKSLHLSLSVFTPSSTQPVREKQIGVPLDRQASLPELAVHAAARLLNVSSYSPDDRRTTPGTNSLKALAAFQAAEALMKQPNDAGLDNAIEKYKEAVDLDPRYAEAYSKLAMAYFRLYFVRGDAAAIDLARANCRSALRLDPNSAYGHLALASVLQQTGDRQRALQEIAKSLALDPSNPDTLISQAKLYAAMGDWTRAEATFARVLAMRPNLWLAHNELGVIFYAQGKYAQALQEFRAASLAAPGNALAFSNLGDIYLKQGRLQQSLDNTRKSFALSPNDAAAATLAAAYRAQRNYPEAIAFAQKAAQLAPTEAVDWLELADCYAASGTHKAESAAAYTRASQVQEDQLRTEPKNGAGWMLLALCRVKEHRPETAAALLQKAASLQADDVDSQLYKARTLELLGHRAEALAVVARCLQQGVTHFQLEMTPDLEGLRADPQFRKVLDGSISTEAAVAS